MAKLPAEVHDHFRKANVLHTYVESSLGEATQHALETGQELLAAKAAIPHGSWEPECDRLFNGSLRTAQFYMRFARDVGALPKAQASALLLLEGTLDGAAKAAKKAARPEPKPKPSSKPPVAPSDEEPQEYGKCPNCAGTKWETDEDGTACAKCLHPHGEPAGDVDEDRLTTQQQKAVKTVEAAQRAFDDLHLLRAKEEHKEAATICKRLLALAKGWK
jgi:hypothetical protein